MVISAEIVQVFCYIQWVRVMWVRPYSCGGFVMSGFVDVYKVGSSIGIRWVRLMWVRLMWVRPEWVRVMWVRQINSQWRAGEIKI